MLAWKPMVENLSNISVAAKTWRLNNRHFSSWPPNLIKQNKLTKDEWSCFNASKFLSLIIFLDLHLLLLLFMRFLIVLRFHSWSNSQCQETNQVNGYGGRLLYWKLKGLLIGELRPVYIIDVNVFTTYIYGMYVY